MKRNSSPTWIQKLNKKCLISEISLWSADLLNLYQDNIDVFKQIFKNVKKKNGGKLPPVSKILTELFIHLDKKRYIKAHYNLFFLFN